MSQLKMQSRAGGDVQLDMEAVDGLKASLRGPVLLPGDAGYEESRLIWNGMIDRRPGLIARCIGSADVIACVNFARERGLLVSIRGGGHNISGLAVGDGAMMIDMSLMRGAWVDVGNKVVRAQGGCTLGDVDRETQLHGLAAVLGFVSNTGIAGLTLGGGFGYLTRRYGWTSDTVQSIQIVTPDGELRRTSEKSDPDLFWALRGGGGNFGVVTEFEYNLYSVGPQVMGGLIAWHASEAKEVLGMYQSLVKEAPPELVPVGLMRIAPPAPWLPPEVHGKPIVAIVWCDTGSMEDAEKRVAPVKAFGNPVGDVIMPRPYTSQQSILDATQPNGRRYYWKSEYLPGVETEMIERFIEHAATIRSPHSAMLLFPLGGALSDLSEDHSAVGNRKAGVVFNIAAAWDDAADDKQNIDWARGVWSDLREFSTGGTYINFLTEEEGDDRIRQALGSNYDRLAKIKKKYDPDNVFRLNKNIAPR